MAKTCTVCGKRAYNDRCMVHKPRKPIQSRSVKPKAVKAKTTKPKTKKRSWYVKELDKVFSIYIRLSKSDRFGYCVCVTCGNKLFWKDIQNGHFISRGKYPTRWDDLNCWPQDYRCNVALKGNYIEYTVFMLDRLGRNAFEDLKLKSITASKITTIELKEMITKYKWLAEIEAEKRGLT